MLKKKQFIVVYEILIILLNHCEQNLLFNSQTVPR